MNKNTYTGLITDGLTDKHELLERLKADKRTNSEIHASIVSRLKVLAGDVDDETLHEGAWNLIGLYQLYYDSEARKQREKREQDRELAEKTW